MHQNVHFLACLCETNLSDTYGLSLFCYPSFKQSEVEKKLSCYIIPYKGEGNSKKPACDGDKILVFPLAFDFEKKSQRNKKVVLRFLQKGISSNHKALIVRLDSKSVPTVKFLNEQQNLLCEVLILKTRQAPAGPITGDIAQGKKRPACGASEEIPAKNPRTQPNKRKSSKEDAGKVKDGEPEILELSDIAEKISRQWRRLGRNLGVSNVIIDELDTIHLDDTYEKAFQMLRQWKENSSEGKISSYQILFDALTKIGCGNLAKNYCLKVSKR